MKLRRIPEDFEVFEYNTLPVGGRGEFAVYELQKTGWTTLDALDRIARELSIPRYCISHAGLKDRHAVTSQWITIRRGPRTNYANSGFSLKYQGQASRAVTSSDIAANRFTIVLRDLPAGEQAALETALEDIRGRGIANYFDDQRFGSWIPDQGFIAEPWIRGDYEEAFRRAFAARHPEDDAAERTEKEILLEHWGDWPTCKQLLTRSHRRSIVTYLCDKPLDFKGAWARVNAELRGLYLSAFQSHLWNQIVSDFFALSAPPDERFEIHLKSATLTTPGSSGSHKSLKAEGNLCPLPSARVALAAFPNPEQAAATLSRLGWSLPDLKVKFPRDRFFSRQQRPMQTMLPDLSGSFAPDELTPGQLKWTLRFQLPRGCYATMVIKHLLTRASGACLSSHTLPVDE